LCSGRPPDMAYPPVGCGVSNLLPIQRIDFCSLNNAHPIDRLCLFSGNHLTKKKISMAKPILDKARTEQYLAELKIDSNVKFEINKELLTKLHNNAYCRRVKEDEIDHIAKFLEILDLIKIANVDLFQLRIKVFPLSLVGDARKWWMDEGDGKINTWEELVKRFFGKLYPISCASNYDRMCDDDEEGRDSLEFIT
ncbi:hypothetical protein Tco_0397642, partial [Tanacetum coccineum]